MHARTDPEGTVARSGIPKDYTTNYTTSTTQVTINLKHSIFNLMLYNH
jgi:hypothetical protein